LRDDISKEVGGLVTRALRGVQVALAGIRHYRCLFTFYVKRMLKAKCARISAAAVIAAMVAELVAPITHFPLFHLGPRSQLALGITLLALGAIGSWAHALQSKANHQYSVLVRSVHVLSAALGIELEAPGKIQLVAYLERTLTLFNPAFGQSKDGIYAGLLLPLPNGDLFRFCHTPASQYNAKGVLPAKGGAAGKAADLGHMIYVPKVQHRHGIRIVDQDGSASRVFRLQKDAFQQFGESAPPFRSLLCVPMDIGSPNGRAVLYVSSTKTDAFNNEFYFDAAQMEAMVLAAVLSKYFKSEHSKPVAVYEN
jgi:hypothetical protein